MRSHNSFVHVIDFLPLDSAYDDYYITLFNLPSDGRNNTLYSVITFVKHSVLIGPFEVVQGESWLVTGRWEVFSKQHDDVWSFILNNSTLQALLHRVIDLSSCSKENDIGG